MNRLQKIAFIAVATLLLTACMAGTQEREAQIAEATAQALETARTGEESAPVGEVAVGSSQTDEADVSYTLRTSSADGLAFVGVGGEIDGVTNPELTANPGEVVAITLVNGDGVQHDLALDAFDVKTDQFSTLDAEQTIVFTVDEAGEYEYYCTVPGHKAAGMVGSLVVGEGEEEAAQGASIVRNPTDLPDPLEERDPETVEITLETIEVEGQLADGATYSYFTYDGQVPGPFIRIREGDTVELTLRNPEDSNFPHSIDLHAVTGPGGGAVHTQTNPGEENTFTFQALQPGLYVYHCATPSVPHHITNGMYGLILVEPEDGLPEVDREFYVMQGEMYTSEAYGSSGALTFDNDKMLNETPEYYVFNGAAAALTTEQNALQAEVGDTVRIFFGVGGPNKTSSFHVIGEIFDRAYPFASLTSPPLEDVQTITVPPGGATMVEFALEVPGRYILVDHALSRLERGLVGFLFAEGDEAPEIFTPGGAEE